MQSAKSCPLHASLLSLSLLSLSLFLPLAVLSPAAHGHGDGYGRGHGIAPPVHAAVVEFEGAIESIYEDFDDHHDSRLMHALVLASGRRMPLHGDVAALDLPTGTQVRLRGRLAPMDDAPEEQALWLLDDEDAAESLDGSTVASSSGTSSISGEQRTLVLAVNFQDDPNNRPWTLAQVNDMVFGQVSNFFYENSYGTAWLDGDSLGWLTIPVNTAECSTTKIGNEADKAARGLGVEPGEYDRLVYVFPRNACGWSGAATVGGSPSRAWINGRLNLRLVAHEIGHNFGLHHSQALECGEASIGGNCQVLNYGDHFDVMGNFTASHLNPFQKSRIGWLQLAGGPALHTVQASGTYVLEPYALDSGGVAALRIPQGTDPTTGAKRWFLVEHRQAVGFDAHLGSNPDVVNGVLVRHALEGHAASSRLLDMTPASDPNGYFDWQDAALAVGQRFVDPETGVSIRTVSTNAAGATVEVVLPGGAPAPGPSPDPVPDPDPTGPVANDVDATAPQGTDVVINVMGNDSHPQGKPMWILAVSQPERGIVTVLADGRVEYAPRRNFSGSDGFSYTITDGEQTATAWVNVEVLKASGGGGGGGGKGHLR